MVLTSSIAGLRGLLGVAHYTAAKHGVVGLMRALAHDLAPPRHPREHLASHQCRHPMIQNDAVTGVPSRPDRPPTRDEFANAAITMNLAVPWIEAVDVANATLFLASDEARHHGGRTLPVDAGATQR